MFLTVVCEDIFHLVCEDVFHLVRTWFFLVTWCVRIFFTWCVKMFFTWCVDTLVSFLTVVSEIFSYRGECKCFFTVMCEDARAIAVVSGVSRINATHRVVAL